MKVLLLFAVCLTLSYGAPSRSLQQDFLDFIQLVPVDELKVVVDKHMKNDLEFQAAISYLQGDDWIAICNNVHKTSDVQDLTKYLRDAGLNLELVTAFLQEFLMEYKIKHHHTHPSLKKFIDDVNAIIPWEQLRNVLNEKMEDSLFFQNFYDKVSSERFHKIFERAIDAPDVLNMMKKLNDIDFPVDHVLKSIYTFLGWQSPTSSPRITEDNIRK